MLRVCIAGIIGFTISAPPVEEEVTIRVTNLMEDTDGKDDSLAMQEEMRLLFQPVRDEYYQLRAARIERLRKQAAEDALLEGLPKGQFKEDYVEEAKIEPRPVRVKLLLHDRGPKEGKPRGFAFISCQCKQEADYMVGRMDNRVPLRSMKLRVEIARLVLFAYGSGDGI